MSCAIGSWPGIASDMPSRGGKPQAGSTELIARMVQSQKENPPRQILSELRMNDETFSTKELRVSFCGQIG